MKPPDPNKWVELLRGEPVLILLDELPPYFEAGRAVAVGDTYLDRLTEIALANLLVAVNSNKLPRACVVITDLSGTAYASGSASITQALQSLNDLEQEVNRNVVRIDPVKINTNEIYHILRTRIFEKTPSASDIEAVADAYGVAVDNAKKMGLSEVSPDQLKTDILNAYPFHPAIRDLYARFKENRGFQQTRALIRIMRLIVAHLWNSGAAAKQGLIGPHEFDLQDASMLSEIRQINAGLEVAVARDIRAEATRLGARRVAILGLTYKEDTEDIRDSPAVTVARTLACCPELDIATFDPYVALDDLNPADSLAAAVCGADLTVVLVAHAAFIAGLPELLDARASVVDYTGKAPLESAILPLGRLPS